MSVRQKRGLLMVILGLSMVFAALWLHNTQEEQDMLAGQNSQVLLSRLEMPAIPARMPEQTVTAMAEKEYQGYTMIGILRIAGLQMELPVLSTWSEDWLQVAPCRYSGSLYTEDLILMGHNYKSHFTPLHKVTVGTEVEFEDVNGIVHCYLVEKTEIIHENEAENLSSDFPLTLFTCTAGGQNRLVVRCVAANN